MSFINNAISRTSQAFPTFVKRPVAFQSIGKAFKLSNDGKTNNWQLEIDGLTFDANGGIFNVEDINNKLAIQAQAQGAAGGSRKDRKNTRHRRNRGGKRKSSRNRD